MFPFFHFSVSSTKAPPAAGAEARRRGDGERRGARGAARGERERDARARAVRVRARRGTPPRAGPKTRAGAPVGTAFSVDRPDVEGRASSRARPGGAAPDVDAHELQRRPGRRDGIGPAPSGRPPVRNVGLGVPRARSAEVRHEREIIRRPHRPTGGDARIRPAHRPSHRSHRAATPVRVESRGGRGGTRVFGRPQLQRRRPTRKGHCRSQSGCQNALRDTPAPRETTPGAGSSRGTPPHDATCERSRPPCRPPASPAEALGAPPRDALAKDARDKSDSVSLRTPRVSLKRAFPFDPRPVLAVGSARG